MPLAVVELCIRVPDVAATAAWYRTRVGVPVAHGTADDTAVVRYGDVDDAAAAVLRFTRAASQSPPPAREGRPAFVWIGLAGFPDARATAAALEARGVDVKLQGQFLDVAFVAHFTDCNGITSEVLQTAFEANIVPRPLPETPLRTERPAVLGQVKLNVRDAQATVGFYRDVLGMRLLLEVPVAQYKFTLYFLGYTDAQPPSADPTAVANREWMWSQRFAQVELQHYHSSPEVWVPGAGEAGYDSVTIAGARDDIEGVRGRAVATGAHTAACADGFVLTDPDGRCVRVVEKRSA